jgi:hypothetical protein
MSEPLGDVSSTDTFETFQDCSVIRYLLDNKSENIHAEIIYQIFNVKYVFECVEIYIILLIVINIFGIMRLFFTGCLNR